MKGFGGSCGLCRALLGFMRNVNGCGNDVAKVAVLVCEKLYVGGPGRHLVAG